MTRASWLVALATASALVAAACSESGDVGSYLDTTVEAGGPSFTPPPADGGSDADLGPTSPLLECEGTSCPAPYATCGDTSSVRCGTNLLTDKNNCGECGHACPNDDPLHAASRCVGGTCVAECETINGSCSVFVWKDCNGILDDGCEVPVSDDPNNCGACGHQCAAGEPCVNGTCGCGAGKTFCPGCDVLKHPVQCVDLQNDDINCGTCNKHCNGFGATHPTCPAQPANTNWGCGAGECTKLKCSDTYADCNNDLSKGCSSDGCEINLATDPRNCGACGNVCAAGEECRNDGSGPQCVPPCEASGKAVCPFGCADLLSDPDNCGECGTRCTANANQKAECRKGICQTKCADGFGDCDGNPANGCEVTLATDPTSCGACGVTCDYAGGQPCIEGKCLKVQCDAGVTK